MLGVRLFVARLVHRRVNRSANFLLLIIFDQIVQTSTNEVQDIDVEEVHDGWLLQRGHYFWGLYEAVG